jgi:fatty-acyl-CoA synthase
MREYWRDSQQTGTALEGGWLHTGDIARRDDRGCLYIVDRKKDMIVSGGFNVYPREIEDVLSSHSSGRMSAVIGVPDSRWGEAVRAFVVLRKGVAPCAEELVELVKTKKGGMSAPKVVEFVDELPMTSVGKIDKRSLREPFWINETRRVG